MTEMIWAVLIALAIWKVAGVIIGIVIEFVVERTFFGGK